MNRPVLRKMSIALDRPVLEKLSYKGLFRLGRFTFQKLAKLLLLTKVILFLNMARKINHPQPNKVCVKRVDLVIFDDLCNITVQPEVCDLITHNVDLARKAAKLC